MPWVLLKGTSASALMAIKAILTSPMDAKVYSNRVRVTASFFFFEKVPLSYMNQQALLKFLIFKVHQCAFLDVDECSSPESYPCYGKCTNTQGSFICQCPHGFEGNASVPNGCQGFTMQLRFIICTSSIIATNYCSSIYIASLYLVLSPS